MVTKEITILEEKGLGPTLASLLVKESMKYNCEITLHHNGKCADAKSFINVMALNVIKKGIIILYADGSDENIAAEAILELFS